MTKTRPAQVIAIDDQVGSLEPGMARNFVILERNHRLSAVTRAPEQTWVDGRRYFSWRRNAQLGSRSSVSGPSSIQAQSSR